MRYFPLCLLASLLSMNAHAGSIEGKWKGDGTWTLNGQDRSCSPLSFEIQVTQTEILISDRVCQSENATLSTAYPKLTYLGRTVFLDGRMVGNYSGDVLDVRVDSGSFTWVAYFDASGDALLEHEQISVGGQTNDAIAATLYRQK